jgi:hypothetical protein
LRYPDDAGLLVEKIEASELLFLVNGNFGHAFGGNHIQRGHLFSRQSPSGSIRVDRKITMFSWYISPWEAARLSLEAQRVMTFHFLRFVSGQERQRHEALSDGEQSLVPGPVNQTVVASAEPATSARSMATRRLKTVPARKAMGVIRAPVGIKDRSRSKVKGKRSSKRGKSRGQRH